MPGTTETVRSDRADAAGEEAEVRSPAGAWSALPAGTDVRANGVTAGPAVDGLVVPRPVVDGPMVGAAVVGLVVPRPVVARPVVDGLIVGWPVVDGPAIAGFGHSAIGLASGDEVADVDGPVAEPADCGLPTGPAEVGLMFVASGEPWPAGVKKGDAGAGRPWSGLPGPVGAGVSGNAVRRESTSAPLGTPPADAAYGRTAAGCPGSGLVSPGSGLVSPGSSLVSPGWP
jgi:hypothetical protein